MTRVHLSNLETPPKFPLNAVLVYKPTQRFYRVAKQPFKNSPSFLNEAGEYNDFYALQRVTILGKESSGPYFIHSIQDVEDGSFELLELEKPAKVDDAKILNSLNILMGFANVMTAVRNMGPETLKSIQSLSGTPDFKEWVSNQNYIPKNVIPVVTRNVSGSVVLSASIRALIELHVKHISGLANGLSLDWETGQMEHSNSFPEMTWAEKYGKAVQYCIEKWMAFYSEHRNDTATIDVMFIEPDPLGKHVVDAWSFKDFLPSSFSGQDGQRNLSPTEKITSVDVSASFSGRCFRGKKVREEAQEILNKLNLVPASHQHDLSDILYPVGRTTSARP